MNKITKKLILLGVVASLGTAMVACGEKEEAPKDEPAVEAEAEDTEEADAGAEHSHTLAFEWRGKVAFEDGKYTLKFNKNDGEETINIGFLNDDGRDVHDMEHDGVHMMDKDSKKEHHHLGDTFHAEHFNAYEIDLEGKTGEVTIDVHKGEYQIFLQHMPEEFDFEILDAEGNKVEILDSEVYEEGTEL